MLDRLAEIETKYEDLAEQINDPDVIANQTEWRKRMKEYSDMTPIVEKYREYKQAKEGIAESLAMLEESIGQYGGRGFSGAFEGGAGGKQGKGGNAEAGADAFADS